MARTPTIFGLQQGLIPTNAGPDYQIDRKQPAAIDFGFFAHTLQVLTIPLGVATENKEIKITGTAIWALEATDNSTEITIKFNDQSGGGIPFRKGMYIRGLAFDRLYISNSALATKSITFVYAVEGQRTLQIENPSSSFTNISFTAATTFNSFADVTIGATSTDLIAAANTDRKELIVTNPLTNSETIRIGDSGAGAANGIPIVPGQTIVISSSDAVYGYNPGAGGQGVAVAETSN